MNPQILLHNASDPTLNRTAFQTWQCDRNTQRNNALTGTNICIYSGTISGPKTMYRGYGRVVTIIDGI